MMKVEKIPKNELVMAVRKANSVLKDDSLRMNNTASNSKVECVYMFGQEEGGNGVCIDPQGWVLTNAHCIAEYDDVRSKPDPSMQISVVDVSGHIFYSSVLALDVKRDLAILAIKGVYDVDTKTFLKVAPERVFEFVEVFSPEIPQTDYHGRLCCLGMGVGSRLGFDDLRGEYEGIRPGDRHDNFSGYGALKHSCCTSWGHSGSPLLSPSGVLVGLHNSYNPNNYQRHGCHFEAVNAFLATVRKSQISAASGKKRKRSRVASGK